MSRNIITGHNLQSSVICGAVFAMAVFIKISFQIKTTDAK